MPPQGHEKLIPARPRTPFPEIGEKCGLAIFAACVPVRSFPPICDLAELDVPEGVDGKSLARILKGEETKVRYVQVPVLE